MMTPSATAENDWPCSEPETGDDAGASCRGELTQRLRASSESNDDSRPSSIARFTGLIQW
jgi:hypothetical protein